MHHIAVLCVVSDGATAERIIQKIFANFRQFCSTLRKDSVADYGWIWRTRCDLQNTNRLVVLSVGIATIFANLRWKFSKT